MPATATSSAAPYSIDAIESSPDNSLVNIGIEMEYPIADAAPNLTSEARRSGDLLDNHVNENPIPEVDRDCSVGSDHTGSEIRSGILDLRTDQPKDWYRELIAWAEDEGYPYAACGYGDTVFGSHIHLSQISRAQRDVVETIASEPWGLVFFCSSVTQTSLDPWRHGGCNPQSPFAQVEIKRQGIPNHAEFRLLEPLHPDHFDVIVDFLRTLSVNGPTAAYEFAEEAVLAEEEKDNLTAVKRYRALDEQYSDFPRDVATRTGNNTTPRVAEWFKQYME